VHTPEIFETVYLMTGSMTTGIPGEQTRTSLPTTLRRSAPTAFPPRKMALGFLGGPGNQGQTSSTWHWRNPAKILTTTVTSGKRLHVQLTR